MIAKRNRVFWGLVAWVIIPLLYVGFACLTYFVALTHPSWTVFPGAGYWSVSIVLFVGSGVVVLRRADFWEPIWIGYGLLMLMALAVIQGVVACSYGDCF